MSAVHAVAPVSISVVLAADADSPLLRRNIASLWRQCGQVGGEVLLADGSADGLAIPHAVHLPGAGVFALRCAAAQRACGWVVAFTEDHCLVAEDWCERVLDAHRRHGDRAAIGGAVSNGSTASAIDRANFLLTFAPFLAPLPRRHPTRTGPIPNVSIKREVLDAHELHPGFVELELLPHLHRVGHLLLDDRVRAEHVQSLGARGAIASHFHNGRSSSSLPARRRPAAQIARGVARTPVLAWRIAREACREVRERGLRIGRRAGAAVFVLACSHAAGELTGLLAGPGSSPERVQ